MSGFDIVSPVILAGGTGSRLGKLTLATNKHLLPYKNDVVIDSVFRIAKTLTKPLVVTDSKSLPSISNYLGSEAYYGIQREPLGIADAIKTAQSHCVEDGIVVLLGDNYFDEENSTFISDCMSFQQEEGCTVFVTEVDDPKHYGVLHEKNSGRYKVTEKPKHPKSNLVLTGAYIFDDEIWRILPTLEKSKRGEYEITDVVNQYAVKGKLNVETLTGEWKDLGKSVEDYWEQAKL